MVILQFVSDKQDIRQSIKRFNTEALNNKDTARVLLRGTTYFVYDAESKQFGPNKFSAYQAITHWSTHYPSDSVNTRYDRERKVSNMSWFSQAA